MNQPGKDATGVTMTAANYIPEWRVVPGGKREDGTYVLVLRDELTLADVPFLKSELGPMVQEEKILIDMSACESVDASIIGALAGFAAERMASTGDPFITVKASPTVFRQLVMLRVLPFKVETEGSATDSLAWVREAAS